jgi:hypothetical protein
MKDEDVKFEDLAVESEKGRNTPTAKTYQIKISFELDKGFIAIWPSISINLHIKSIEINWLIFGIYIDL